MSHQLCLTSRFLRYRQCKYRKYTVEKQADFRISQNFVPPSPSFSHLRDLASRSDIKIEKPGLEKPNDS